MIAQDLLFVPMIMIINGMGGENGIDLIFIPKILGAIGLLIGLIWYLSRKSDLDLLFKKTVEKYNDLIPVAALTWCLVGAGLSEYFGFSPAYGAFMAGLIIGSSTSKHIVMPKIEPMQSVMLMVFFLSIGMLINFEVILENYKIIAGLLLAAMVFKTAACIALLKIFLPEDRWRCSFVTGLTISQIGEFSFILAGAALAGGIFDQTNYKIIISVIALSLMLSPIWMAIMRKFVDIAYTKKSVISLSQALGACFSISSKKVN